MTLNKAQAITGLTIEVERIGKRWIARSMPSEHGAPAMMAIAASEKGALDKLVRSHWRWVTITVAQRQNYRCAYCGLIKPLDFHHVTPRSKGRNDRPDNIVGVCRSCHERRHRVRHLR